jgi:hypothetical protein
MPEDRGKWSFEFDHRPDLFGGTTVLRTTAKVVGRNRDGRPEVTGEQDLVLIPYYAWAHRGKGPMAVWLARTIEAARPEPYPTLARTAKASSSFGGDLGALSDQQDPISSGDHENPFLHWWPKKGTTEWVQYEFPKPAKVQGVEVYWFDDTGRGECRLPKNWRLLCRIEGQWREVSNPSGYGVAGDRWNRCAFDPVEADALRLEICSKEGWAGGIHEWKVIETGAAPPGDRGLDGQEKKSP